jgi:transcriptional regulator with XRE-family HTH domain
MKYDLNAVLDRIMDGESQAEIARSLGITPGRLSQILSADEEIAKRSAFARSMSSEAWLDRGLEAVASAMDKTGNIDATAARAFAQECARRAAIRNPAYSDKQRHEVTGADGGAMRFEIIAPWLKPTIAERN